MADLRSILASGLLLLCSISLYGQYDRRENNVWAFGRYGGLDFNNGLPISIPTAISTDEGSTAVSDEQGNLLFYTNGDSVWNRNHIAMPNGRALAPGAQVYSTTQAAAIVPFYDNPDRWYVFTLGASNYAGTLPPGNSALSYSVVDMTLDNGMGDVIPGMKNIPLDQHLSEKMISIPGSDCRIWLVTQTRDSIFKAWAITESGVNPTPVISHTGFAFPNPMSERVHLAGVLKASPNGRKLAGVYGISTYHFPRLYPINAAPGIQLYDFDPATGIVSNAQTLSTDSGLYYGAAFSPDNSKLYIRVAPLGASRIDILQYDLNAGNLIPYSRLQIATNTNNNRFISDIQLAPDGRIYIPYTNTIFDRINQPNLRGAACQYEQNSLTIPANPNQGIGLGLHNIVNIFPTLDTTYETHVLPFCYRDSQLIYALPGTVRHKWEDGSRDSFFIVRDTGTYVLQSIGQCIFRYDTFRVIFPDTLFSHRDTNICNGQALVLPAPEGRDEYLWNDLSNASQRTITQTGAYHVYSSLQCQPYIDSFTVHPTDMNIDLGPDTIVCSNPPLRLAINIQDAVYQWPDGSTDNIYDVWEDGTYRVRVAKDGCDQTDSIRVRFIPIVQQLGPDTVICRGDRLVLEANAPAGADITWHNGSKTAYYPAEDTGLYWVTVQLPPCTATDTIHITHARCSCQHYTPSAFTPNGDGRNDIFRPVFETGCPVTEYILYIYNRWGALVYSGADPADGWDGTYSGAPAEPGVYMYYASFKQGTHRIPESIKGDLMLIR